MDNNLLPPGIIPCCRTCTHNRQNNTYFKPNPDEKLLCSYRLWDWSDNEKNKTPHLHKFTHDEVFTEIKPDDSCKYYWVDDSHMPDWYICKNKDELVRLYYAVYGNLFEITDGFARRSEKCGLTVTLLLDICYDESLITMEEYEEISDADYDDNDESLISKYHQIICENIFNQFTFPVVSCVKQSAIFDRFGDSTSNMFIVKSLSDLGIKEIIYA